MQSNTNIPVESYKKLYDGDYSNFKEFSEDIKVLLRPINSLAVHILEGTISVTKRREDQRQTIDKKAELPLALNCYIQCSTYERAGKTDVVSLLADNLMGCSSKVVQISMLLPKTIANERSRKTSKS